MARKKTVQILCEKDLKDKLTRLAAFNNKTVSTYLNELLEDIIDELIAEFESK